MRQTKTWFPEPYGIFCKLADQFSELNKLFNSFKLLDEFPKSKKSVCMVKSLPVAIRALLFDHVHL